MERVVSRTQKISGHSVKVHPYYPFLEEVMEDETNSEDEEIDGGITDHDYAEVSCDSDMLDYLKTYHIQKFDKCVKIPHHVDLQFPIIIEALLYVQQEVKKTDIRAAKTDLKKVIDGIKKTRLDIPDDILHDVQHASKEMLKDYRPEEVVVTNGERDVTVIGGISAVELILQGFRDIMDRARTKHDIEKRIQDYEESGIPEKKLKLLEEHGIISEVEKKYNYLKISTTADGGKLIFRGPKEEYSHARVDIISKYIAGITENNVDASNGVTELMKNDPRAIKSFNDELKNNKMVSMVFVKEKRDSKQLFLLSLDDKNEGMADKLLSSYYFEKILPVTETHKHILVSKLWTDFKKQQENSCLINIIKDDHGLSIAGKKPDVEEISRNIGEFLKGNTKRTISLALDEGEVKYLETYMKNEITNLEKHLRDCFVAIELRADKGDILITGNERGLGICQEKFDELSNNIFTKKHVTTKPGMSKFFHQQERRKELKQLERLHEIVVLSHEPCQGTSSSEEKSTIISPSYDVPPSQSGKCLCTYTTKGNQTLSVYHDDLTAHKVDVIVNAANNKLEHGGGLAGAIIKAGGKEIQEECWKHVKDKGEVMEGHVHLTGAGQLPCKAIIHAVGPIWNYKADVELRSGTTPQQVKLLKLVCHKLLEKASIMKFRSIGIPAISTGIYSFPSELATEIIIEATHEFLKKNPHVSLKEVHFVNNDPTNMFKNQFKKLFQSNPGFIDNTITQPIPSKRTTQRKRAEMSEAARQFTTDPNIITINGCKIVLKRGNIAKQKVEAIVNSTSSDLNLSSNASAKALLAAAGSKLQAECKAFVANYGQLKPGGVAVTSGASATWKCVFHIVCSQWGNGAGEKVLRQILQRCLATAEQKAVRSIAIPAIGTGNLNFPRDRVAKATYEEVVGYLKNNPSTSLKEVNLVVFDQDVLTVNAFEQELQKKQPAKRQNINPKSNGGGSLPRSSKRQQSEPKMVGNCLRVGDVRLDIDKGDITKAQTEAIAYISNNRLDIGVGGGTGAAILKAGGEDIEKECERLGPQPDDCVVASNAGNLPCKHLFHMIPQSVSKSGIEKIVLKCLQKAGTMRLSSIAFPALGTGNLGISPKDAAHAILCAVKEFIKTKPTRLHHVKVIVYQEEMVEEFKSSIQNLPSGWWEKIKNFFSWGSSEEEINHIEESQRDQAHTLYFYGSRDSVQKAIKDVEDIFNSNSVKKDVRIDDLDSLDEETLAKIRSLQRKFDVRIEIEKVADRIIIEGDLDDVGEVKLEIFGISNAFKERQRENETAQLLAESVQWSFKDDDGSWTDYDASENIVIEKAFSIKKEKSVIIRIDDIQYEITFNDRKEKRMGTSEITDVQRKDTKIVGPAHWDPQPKDSKGADETVHLVELDPVKHLAEYNQVKDSFCKTTNANTIKIERIQNPTLYQIYTTHKNKMDAEDGSNEKILYHGTAEESCNMINAHGFDRSYCGKNAAYYGDGVYFAVDSSYSAQSRYAIPNPNHSNKYVYQARVLVGESTIGKQGMKAPPLKQGQQADSTKKYDSLVDNTSAPVLYVVFRDWQCYPEYLITFQ